MNRRRTKNRRRLSVETLEYRRVLAASFGWDGPGQGSAELTYYLANHPASLSLAETEAAIETALNAWSSVVDVTFTQTDRPGLRDSIDISFTPIDGADGTLGLAYLPDDVNRARIAGDIQFDLAETWEVGNALGRQAFDLVYVAVHEIGHALGLDHSSSADSVLKSFVTPTQRFSGLADSDISAIQQLYAAVTTTPDLAGTDGESVSSDPSQLQIEPSGDVLVDQPDNMESESDDAMEEGTGDVDDADEPSAESDDSMGDDGDVDTDNSDADNSDADSSDRDTDDSDVDDSDTEDGNTEDSDTENSDTDCDHSSRRYRGMFNRGLLTKNATDILGRFDGDEDGILVEDEIPDRLWEKWIDLGVDVDGDGQITEGELADVITALRQEVFDAKDQDEDGLLTREEVGERFWRKVAASDVNGDESVTFDEWDTWLDTAEVKTPESHHRLRLHHRAVDSVFSAIARFRPLR